MLTKFIKSLQAIFNVPRGTRLEEYIAWRRPQNHADLERIVRDYQTEMRMW
jgi:hypothetical protein